MDDHPPGPLPSAVAAVKANHWRCVGGRPKLIARYPLDARGYLRATWFRLDQVRPNEELYADPR